MLTAKAIKPICEFQQVFQSTYLFGAFSPINGHKFLLELPTCSTQTFQIFLNEFASENPLEFKIIVLDNGAFHKSKALVVPRNIALVFLPPYSPELNPAENMWATLKRPFTNKLFKSLNQISDFISDEIKNISSEKVMSICGFRYVFNNLIWTT